MGRWDLIVPAAVTKAPVAALTVQNSSALMPVGYGGSWLGGIVGEPFSGAWQRNISASSPKDVTAFSAVYTCIDLIASDISKLRIKLVEFTEAKVWQEVRAGGLQANDSRGTAFLPVLTKPNEYQTRIQFLHQWQTSKLLHGNTYVLKEYDDRQTVRAMYVLDPRLVTVNVAANGSVFYVLKRDPLATVTDDALAVPASEIIHDRGPTLWHPLIGVSPIYACGAAAVQGLRIQHDSEEFFTRHATPGGQVIGPPNVDIPDPKLQRMKQEWEDNYGPGGRGRTAFFTHGMKFEPMRMSSVDAQLIEQLKWTVEDVARCFKVPLHMLGVQGSNPSYNNIGALNQAYYNQCLQHPIEALELLLDEGLGLVDAGYGAELDLKTLVRMDPAARMETNSKGTGAGLLTINEGRADYDDLPPIAGGDKAYLQQQNWALQDLADRDPAGLNPAPAPAATAPAANDDTAQEDPAVRRRNAVDFLTKELANA
jgi:HK97 family phage portal protein